MEYDIRPLQLHLLDILLSFQQVCEKQGLKYYMVDGSLLGAMRHKGFIPWDDDMDIAMPRDDYERLIQHSKEWLPEPLEFVCFENDPKYPLHFGKIQDASTTLIERPHLYYLGGVYVDVFPIDGAPEGKWRQKFYDIHYKYLKKALYFLFRDPYKHGHGPSSWIPLLCQWLTSNAAVQRRLRNIMTRYSFDDCTLVADYDDGMNGICDKSVLGRPTPIEFEGKTLMGVEHADTYLTQKYGDYMVVPPHDHQRQHNFFYLDYNLPYREYDDKRVFMKQDT